MTDKELFCEQIRICEKSMYSLAFSVVKNDTDASDVIGDAILRAYENFGSLRNIKAFKPWILKIVHNTAIEFVRKNLKVLPIEDVDTVADLETDDVLRLSLKDAVLRIRQPYSTVIVLYYYEGFSISQISKITDSEISAVKKRLSRARNMLREILKEDFVNE